MVGQILTAQAVIASVLMLAGAVALAQEPGRLRLQTNEADIAGLQGIIPRVDSHLRDQAAGAVAGDIDVAGEVAGPIGGVTDPDTGVAGVVGVEGVGARVRSTIAGGQKKKPAARTVGCERRRPRRKWRLAARRATSVCRCCPGM